MFIKEKTSYSQTKTGATPKIETSPRSHAQRCDEGSESHLSADSHFFYTILTHDGLHAQSFHSIHGHAHGSSKLYIYHLHNFTLSKHCTRHWLALMTHTLSALVMLNSFLLTGPL